jgi:hypothetical protein
MYRLQLTELLIWAAQPISYICEVNQYGVTNGADVRAIINRGLGAAAKDLNGDGLVNVVDIQFVISAALGLVSVQGRIEG